MALIATIIHVLNLIDAVIVSLWPLGQYILGSNPCRVKRKTNKISVCCFSAKHAALRSNSKDCLALNQDNVFDRNDMSTNGLLFQWARTHGTIKIQLRLLYTTDIIIIISLNVTCSLHDVVKLFIWDWTTINHHWYRFILINIYTEYRKYVRIFITCTWYSSLNNLAINIHVSSEVIK